MKVPTTDELMAARPGLLKDAGKFDATMRGFADFQETAAGDLIDEEPEDEGSAGVSPAAKTEDEKTEDRRLETAENAANESDPSDSPPWLSALTTDLQPLGRALESAMQAGDDAAMRAALKKISDKMPDFLTATNLEDNLAAAFAAALTDEE